MKKLNITNGQYFNDIFQNTTGEIGIPFNECMMTGYTIDDIFSTQFMKLRARELNSDINEYQNIMSDFFDCIHSIYDCETINIWFGSDVFCQMNMLTLLAFLDKIAFSGVVYCTIIDDQKSAENNQIEIVDDKKAIKVNGYYDIYKKVLVNRISTSCDDIFMKKAIELYFDYLSDNGKLANIVKENKNLDEMELIIKLLQNSSEYGLSDIQAKMLIQKIINRG